MFNLVRLFFTGIAMFIIICFSQAQSSNTSKAAKFHEKALKYYNTAAYDAALDEVKKAIKADPSFIESWLLSGDINAIKGSYQEAIQNYETAIKIDSSFFIPAYYILANLYFNQKEYTKSIEYYTRYLSYPLIKKLEKEKAILRKETAQFRIKSLKNPVPFNPVNLGTTVNSEGYEFVNYISPDGHKLYFTRRLVSGDSKDEQFFYSQLERDSTWSIAIDLGTPINTTGDEGALALSPDGQYLFFSACSRPDGFGSCDLYVSRLVGKVWQTPVNLGPVINTPGWESQPSFSPDGRTLYFVSTRKGGFGNSDIWIAKLNKNGRWSKPVNAGGIINTSEAERGPFIHPDGVTLYYSSKGHPGMGEGDIFYSRLEESTWSKPINVGYPINTEEDEVTMIVDNEGHYAYYSSAKTSGLGLQDIYAFELPESAKPQKVSYMKGIVYDSLTRKPLMANVRLLDPNSGDTIISSLSNEKDGNFLLCIPAGRDYALNVERKGYLFYSAHFSMIEETDLINPFTKDIPLKPIREGESIVLRNIFFETDSFNLLSNSKAELNHLFNFLANNEKMMVEISGHTDNAGNDHYNQRLSEKRAHSVYQYLVSMGIDPLRLSYKGYGQAKPVAPNETIEGRALNRRTEIIVVQVK